MRFQPVSSPLARSVSPQDGQVSADLLVKADASAGSPLREQLKLSETNENCSENLKKAIDALEVEVKRLQNRVTMQNPITAELQQDQLQEFSK